MNYSRRFKISRWLPALVAALALGWAAPAQAQIIYAYDELGRLVGVTDPSQGTAVYNYDSVGNILSIQRYAVNAVLIINFAPKSGPTGTAVTIAGTGFSTTPSQNTVTFNGTQATVTSATATQLVVTVPGGATTGTIGVTAPGGSTTSSASYTVTGATGAPTITGFTPSIAVKGTAVTVSGTNFDPAPANDQLTFNSLRVSQVTAATSTSLSTSVPILVGSGHLSLRTPTGSTTSSTDFFIPPPPNVASDVQTTGRITFGGSSQAFTISTAGKIGMVLFDAVAGQGAVITISSVSITNSLVSVWAPNNNYIIGDTPVSTSGTSLYLPNLPTTGSYMIRIVPQGSYTGSMTLQAVAPDLVMTNLTGPSSPVAANADGTYTLSLSWTLANQGSLTTSPQGWMDRVYLSTKPTKDSSAVLLNSFVPATSPLGIGANYTKNGAVFAPAGTAPGNYYAIVAADPITEVSTTNNARSAAVTLKPLPDLVIQSLSGVPSAPVARNANGNWYFYLTWTIKNQGAGDAAPSWSDKAFISSTNSWSTSAFQIMSTGQGSTITAGNTYTNSAWAYIPSWYTPGDYWFIFYTDSADSTHPNGYLAESNESNNQYVSAAKITLLP